MPYTINQLKQRIFQPVFSVYQIFQDFFGEPFTDLQNIPTDEEFRQALEGMDITPTNGLYNTNARRDNRIRNYYETLRPYILVWWPRVTVTNESNRSISIQDLYAKAFLTLDGRIPYEYRGFKLTRTTFPENQFRSGYCHSHVPRISGVPSFSDPCLGTGPINNTISDLKNGYDETVWMLFCQELSLYVTVESLLGGPYIRMESVGAEYRSVHFQDYDNFIRSLHSIMYLPESLVNPLKETLEKFIPYYLENGHLSINYKDGKFVPGMPYFDFMIDLSNSFIGFFNQGNVPLDADAMFNQKILMKVRAANGMFYESDIPVQGDYSQYEGTYMFDFKGKQKHLHIDQQAEVNIEEVTLLNHSIAMYILNNVLRIINYRYRNEYTKQHSSSRGEENPAATYQTVLYL